MTTYRAIQAVNARANRAVRESGLFAALLKRRRRLNATQKPAKVVDPS